MVTEWNICLFLPRIVIPLGFYLTLYITISYSTYVQTATHFVWLTIFTLSFCITTIESLNFTILNQIIITSTRFPKELYYFLFKHAGNNSI